jgi:alpha-N-acetylglucosaminidase
MLHDYGGTIGMYGKIDAVVNGPHDTRNNFSSMVGIGITPEGIHNSYPMYDLMLENGWRGAGDIVKDVDKWFEMYSRRRYAVDNPHLARAWQLERTAVTTRHLY